MHSTLAVNAASSACFDWPVVVMVVVDKTWNQPMVVAVVVVVTEAVLWTSAYSKDRVGHRPVVGR